MKQRFLLILALVCLVAILIGLNAVSYVQKEKVPDSELNPNRSTYNVGATGTRAFYEFLAESGYQVKRWREPIAKLKYFDASVASTFVVIGKVRREFSDDEIAKLMNWVSSGGTLVIIDRDPPSDLIASTAYYSFEVDGGERYSFEVDGGERSMSEIEKDTMMLSVDPSSEKQMTAETKAVRVMQPSTLTKDVIAIQPSKFASSVKFVRSKMPESEDETTESEDDATVLDEANTNSNLSDIDEVETEESLTSENSNTTSNQGFNVEFKTGDGTRNSDKSDSDENDENGDTEEEVDDEAPDVSLVAPVAHIGNDEKTLVVDFPFDSGKVIFVTDPYVVANGGIRLADNVQFAANVVGSTGGIIAFDEFHQGYSNNENHVLEYFSGTPLVAILLQLLVLIGVIFYSQSRRFARALPHQEPNRLSKLEYVSAMAQLQRRTKAYDLAIENIYQDFRRRVSRLTGVDNHTTSREELANLISDRTDYSAKDLDDLMFKCEDITHGEPTSKKEIVQIITKLRKIEKRLGLERRDRKRRT